MLRTSALGLRETLSSLQGQGKEFVVLERHPDFPGIVFQSLNQPAFIESYSGYLSPYGMLRNTSRIHEFLGSLESDGVEPIVLDSANPYLKKYERWAEEFKVPEFKISKFHPYQTYAIQQALDVSFNTRKKYSGYFFNWGTGTGKSIVAAAGTQYTLKHKLVDVVIVLTERPLMTELFRTFEKLVTVTGSLVDAEKNKRESLYQEELEYYITNYDKCHWDKDHLIELVGGKRVLFILDECQRILNKGSKNRARKGFEEIQQASRKSATWTLSASVVNQSPLRYWDVYNVIGQHDLLGTKKKFYSNYAKRVHKYENKWGIVDTHVDWDLEALQSIQHTVNEYTQAIRKTDPEVRPYFKGIQTLYFPLRLSPLDQQLYDVVLDLSREAYQNGDDIGPYYRLLQYICICPEALEMTSTQVASLIPTKYYKLITNKNSNKIEALTQKIEVIQSQGDKVLVFTQFTNMSLFFLEAELKSRKIKFVSHHGGQKTTERQQAIDTFKNDPEVTVFLTSDAGAHGLNMQEARYVINFDIPYDYDTLMQRNSRIDRADSYLDGLTSYVFVYENTIEEKIWKVNQSRREVASATQGTFEALSTDVDRMTQKGLAELMFVP